MKNSLYSKTQRKRAEARAIKAEMNAQEMAKIKIIFVLFLKKEDT